MGPGLAGIDICTWKRRREASVASTFSFTGVCAYSVKEDTQRRASTEIRISFDSINALAPAAVKRCMRIFLIAGILATAAVAQSITEPPPIVQLVRKPGTGGASLKPYANAKAAVNVIGMASVTGLPET